MCVCVCVEQSGDGSFAGMEAAEESLVGIRIKLIDGSLSSFEQCVALTHDWCGAEAAKGWWLPPPIPSALPVWV